MKRLMIFGCVLLLGLVFLSSCAQPKRADYLWTGPGCEITGIFQPVFAVWCIPSPYGWKLHRSTNDVGILREIIRYLCEPEEFMLIEISPDEHHQLLWLAYLDPRYDKWTLKKMRFKMEGDVFAGPRGKSRKLVSLLQGMDEVERYFRMVDPNEIREGLKQLHEEWKKREAAEDANRPKP
ncbi:MAG: hypothetical protein ACYTEL_10945 [Planctomycetota bacterium]|jgi:hypothetical protein